MKQAFSAVVGLAMAFASASALASATTVSSVDWAAMTVSTTGNLTYTMQSIYGVPRMTRILTWSSDSMDESELMARSDSGFSGSVVNSSALLSSTTNASGEHGGIATGIARTSFDLDGTGTLTLRVPYEFHLAQDGTYLAKGSLYVGIEGTYSYFSTDSVIATGQNFGYGSPDQSGFVTLRMDSNGGKTNYVVRGYVDTQIQPGVPEPESYAMIGLGLAAVWLARRKQKN